MRKKKHPYFKSAEEEYQWRLKTMMTIGKLIDYLKTLDPNGFVYRMEMNTGDWQEIPDDIPSLYIATVKDAKKQDRRHLRNVYKSSYKTKAELEKKVRSEMRSIYKYTEDNGIVFSL